MYNNMKTVSNLAAHIIDLLHDFIKPGLSTEDINRYCHHKILELDSVPACLGYKGFPKAVCVSYNHIICHGISSEKCILNEGDIVSVDLVVQKNGYHGDTCFTYQVGNINRKNQYLIDAAYKSMWNAISIIKAGIFIGDLGYIMEHTAQQMNFNVVKDFCGHGIGKEMHTTPNIPFYGNKNTGEKLQSGQFITIEPMLTIGKSKNKILNDGWTAVTTSGENSAQFEHTIMVLENGFEVMTYNSFDKKNNKPQFG